MVLGLMFVGGIHCAGSGSGVLTSRISYAGVYMPNPAGLRDITRCEPTRHYRQFYFFFGTTMIDRSDPAEIFPETERYYYLLEQEKTSSDWIVSILFGTLFTITRSSMFVTACEIPAGSTATTPFQSPTRETSRSGEASSESESIHQGASPARTEAAVQKRIDAARDRARAARERAEKIRQENGTRQ